MNLLLVMERPPVGFDQMVRCAAVKSSDSCKSALDPRMIAQKSGSGAGRQNLRRKF
jgi:hypothetical protein